MFLIFFSWLFLLAAAISPDQYTDAFARHKMWPMCGQAGTNHTTCLEACFNNWEFGGETLVGCDLEPDGPDTCAGSVSVSHDDQAIIISFRGSVGDHQVTEENGSLGDKIPFPGGGMVSHYFYNAFLQVWNGGMKNAYNTFKNKYPDYEVWITGHSLGGVMASLGASHISQTGYAKPSQIRLMNFAGPHGGDPDWAQRMPDLVPWAYRVVHHWDYVPHIPTNPNWTYTHHKIEIWYNNSMANGDPYITCVELESKNCSDSVNPSDYTWGDHGNYFEGKGCTQLCQKAPLPSGSS